MQSALRKQVFLCAPLPVLRERPTQGLFSEASTPRRTDSRAQWSVRLARPVDAKVPGANGSWKVRTGRGEVCGGGVEGRADETHLEGEGPQRPTRVSA